jgi:hypothetical protein
VKRDECERASSPPDIWLSRPCSPSVVVTADSWSWLERLSPCVRALRMLAVFAVGPVLALAIEAGRSWDAWLRLRTEHRRVRTGIGEEGLSSLAAGGPTGSGVESDERDLLNGDIDLNAVGG